jgi:cyanophycinase
MGFILLEGGAEFGGQMEIPDRQAVAMAGGMDVPTHVTVLPVIDRLSADAPEFAGSLKNSKLIYLLGGLPRYLGETLANTRCWQAIQAAYYAGAVIAGSSAGAMVLGQYYYDPVGAQVLQGLGLAGGICVLPHHDTFGNDWAAPLGHLLPDTILVGIDEETGIIDNASGDRWQVFGKGAITIYRKGQIEKYASQQTFVLNKD